MNGPVAFRAVLLVLALTLGCAIKIAAAESASTAASMELKVPAGFTIELVAGALLVERPIVASFDDEGRLYVAESSGSNDPVEKQLEERPHRVVRLEDTDGDGKFDRRVVFADRMMFPEGAQFFDGSLYVSAPPSIWKLTDTDNDGVADERVEWFQGKTLTGCANDLHGPYVGLDGWLYWCKGAFAEQTHIVQGREWKTRAAHIFRCRPDGSGFEPVMTGGMDNPVDVVFTPEGERILSATFLESEGRRDGIVHAIYGGVYGKEHGVLDGHPRTGELMPALVLMSPAAPCGLERYDSVAFGPEYRGNLFACQFNLRRVSRHVLRPEGSTYASEDNDFLSSDNVDFHPTDVLMDADGSLLVLDTGGWYKLCCPTSQLWKPDVLGGIYRVRRSDGVKTNDPRGREIDWAAASNQYLWALHCDARPAVRQRASRVFLSRAKSKEAQQFVAALGEKNDLAKILFVPSKPRFRPTDARTAVLARVWTLGQLDSASARAYILRLLDHEDESVRHAALNVISLHRRGDAYPRAVELLVSDVPAIRRVAAEALGRFGNAAAVPHLLTAAADAQDRILQHSITYALIELADPSATQRGFASKSSGTQAAALIAVDQMPGGRIEPQQVIPLMNASDESLRGAARWLVSRHTEWGGELSEWFRQQLAGVPAKSKQESDSTASEELESMLAEFAVHPAIQQLVSETLSDEKSSVTAKRVALRVMAQAKLDQSLPGWRKALADVIARDTNRRMTELAVAAAQKLPIVEAAEDGLNRSLLKISDSRKNSQEMRVSALAAIASSMSEINDSQFNLIVGALAVENPVTMRSAAAQALAEAPLTSSQLEQLCTAIESSSPLELNRLLAPFVSSTDDKVGMKLLTSLNMASALPSLRIDVLRATMAKYGSSVQQGIDELESKLNVDAATQRKRIEELLPHMAKGDVARGHAVFYSSKAVCSACHRLGYAGGTVGPELTRIGESRTERDLLESILYPSLSFVRSYEPVSVVTVDGRTINGTIRDETDKEYILATGPDQEARVAREDVEQIDPSTVSVMPGGLDGQLSAQELADLVAFLKNATGK